MGSNDETLARNASVRTLQKNVGTLGSVACYPPCKTSTSQNPAAKEKGLTPSNRSSTTSPPKNTAMRTFGRGTKDSHRGCRFTPFRECRPKERPPRFPRRYRSRPKLTLLLQRQKR